MDDRCLECEYLEQCDLAGYLNFCEDCQHYEGCSINHISCRGLYDMECNNGFELRE